MAMELFLERDNACGITRPAILTYSAKRSLEGRTTEIQDA